MKFTACSEFSPEEENLNRELNALFAQWCDHLGQSGFWDHHDIDHFVTDGIFPGYLAQRLKILFIGKENLFIAGQNFIDVFYPAIHGKIIGGNSINRHTFFRRMLRVAYGLIHDCPDWNDIPSASEIADVFGRGGGISFAFMNLAKVSHEYGGKPGGEADVPAVMDFVKRSSAFGKNFFQQEMEIIRPDGIITMDLEEYLCAMGDVARIGSASEGVDIWRTNLRGRDIPLINLRHFANFTKSEAKGFYGPLCLVLRNWERKKESRA